MIPLLAPWEIDAVARAGAVVAGVLERLIDACAPGVDTGELDRLARRLLESAGAEPIFLGFTQAGSPPFPASVCVCVNDQVAHGIPGRRVLRAGDLVSVDMGASVDGWCADASRAVVVGPDPSGEGHMRRRRLVLAAHAATDAAIAAIAPGVRWSSVADAARNVAEACGFRLMPGFAGHGVGRTLHEPPRAPMYPGPRDDFVLRPGMVLTVEPIVVALAREGGGLEVVTGSDGWTISTRDGSEACQFEQTVAVVRVGGQGGGQGGGRVLTRAGGSSRRETSGPGR